MALRGVVGLMRSWCVLKGVPEMYAPCKATLVRRLPEVVRLAPLLAVRDVLTGPRVVAIDATGLELRGRGSTS
jgi:hypothetical protein